MIIRNSSIKVEFQFVLSSRILMDSFTSDLFTCRMFLVEA